MKKRIGLLIMTIILSLIALYLKRKTNEEIEIETTEPPELVVVKTDEDVVNEDEINEEEMK